MMSFSLCVSRRRCAPRLASVLILLTTTTSCFGNRALPEVKELVELPESYARVEGEKKGEEMPLEKVPLDRWCSDFGQPELDALVEQAFESNLSLMASWARLRQSEALLAQTQSNLYPQVDLSATATRSKSPAFGGQNIPGQPSFFKNNFYRVEGSVSYEIDLWGKLAAQREAAEYDYMASRADVETAALSLTSSVAEAWFDVLAQQQKDLLISEQIELNERYVALLELRFQQGSSSVLDINQQRQQIQGLKAQQRTARQQRMLALQRLATLVGKAPDDTEALAAQIDALLLPELTSLPEAGVPADLLERRPDLRAAHYRLESANKKIAVAVRDRLPTLRLSLSTFLQALDIKNLLNDFFWSVGAAASQPLVDGGRRKQEVKRAEAVQDEAYYAYGNTLLTALTEVQTAIVSEHYQALFIEDLEEQYRLAETSLTLSRESYSRGRFDFLRVLTSLQALQQVEQNLIDARRRRLGHRLQLCRALGGSWTTEVQAPATPPENQSDS